MRDGYTIKISGEGDALTLHAPGQPPLPLRTLSDGRFRATALDCELTIEAPDGEGVLRLCQEDMTLTATRLV